ncbi:cholinesterase 2-like [Liolophura sinensis]|uniref:cholinesterase 2-like n=1 Tax=Liolophura sinensis TaxID=3198878 RepID=UPI0031594A9A
MYWPTTLTFLLLSGFISMTLTQEDTLRPVIRTSKGEVQGSRTFITNQQIPVDRFLGIPYAQPPVGQGRFRRPLEAQPWTNIRDATQYSSACFQTFKYTGFRGDDMWIPTVPVSEDCLYLNIWVPRNIQRPMRKLTTLVWVYGGGFISGSSDLQVYDGSFMAATHNAIIVSMNYRVGPFGFLNLGVPEASGNVGLMDQSLALKWTYQNIEAFGGDRNKITLFGESAGSASVSYHLLAQPSWDYFSNAIMMSSTALCDWAFQKPRESVKYSDMYAKELGCDRDNAQEVVECLRKKSAHELASFQMNPWHFKPTVDGSFITKSPEELIRNKDFKRCNILLGFTTDEQTYFMQLFDSKKFDYRNSAEPSVTLPEIKNIINRVTLSTSPIFPNTSLAFEHLLQVYVNGVPKKIRGTNVKVVDNIVGDHDFKCPVIRFARAYATEDLGVYLYHFHHRSPNNPWPQWMGVIHGYEIEFAFGMPYNASGGYSVEDKRISDVLMSYLVTFASTGNPNSQTFGERMWPNFTESDESYKIIQSGLLETKQYPRYAQCSFWEDFLPVLEKQSESTALAIARCTGSRDGATFLSVMILAAFSVLIASKHE